jgi:hypothetical protein
MDSITINNLQNEAQNMIIGSKQHALFQGVTNNPSLLSNTQVQEPEMSCVPAPEVRSVSISGPGGSIEAIAVADKSEMNDVTGFGSRMGYSSSHNNHLYGMLSPCNKQYGNNHG